MKAGDTVHFDWLGQTLTGKLIVHPYPDRKYLTVRTKKNDFSVPREDVRPID